MHPHSSLKEVFSVNFPPSFITSCDQLCLAPPLSQTHHTPYKTFVHPFYSYVHEIPYHEPTETPGIWPLLALFLNSVLFNLKSVITDLELPDAIQRSLT